MPTRRVSEQRYSQPREVYGFQGNRASNHTSYDKFRLPQRTARRRSRSSRSDIQYTGSSTDSDYEEQDSESEYISRRVESASDRIAPDSNSSPRQRSVRFIDKDTTTPHRLPTRRRISKHRLETWGFGGFDEATMSPDEHPRTHRKRAEDQGSEIDTDPYDQTYRTRGAHQGSDVDTNPYDRTYRKREEYQGSDIDSDHPHIDDQASDIASNHSSSASHSDLRPANAHPSFRSPPLRLSEAPTHQDDPPSDSGSDIASLHSHSPRSSFCSPIPTQSRRHSSTKPPHSRRISHAPVSFSYPHITRGSSISHSGRSSATYASDRDSISEEDGIHSRSDSAEDVLSGGASDIASVAGSDVQDYIDDGGSDEECIGSGDQEMLRPGICSSRW